MRTTALIPTLLSLVEDYREDMASKVERGFEGAQEQLEKIDAAIAAAKAQSNKKKSHAEKLIDNSVSEIEKEIEGIENEIDNGGPFYDLMARREALETVLERLRGY